MEKIFRKVAALFVMAVVCGLYSSALDFTVGELSYSTFDGLDHLRVVSCSKTEGELAIPEHVEYNGTSYIVTQIGYQAFYASKLAKITLPPTITRIMSSAFYGCAGLRSINLPEGLADIDSEAFYTCAGLTDVTLPKTLEHIGELAFSGTKCQIYRLTPNLTSMHSRAFYTGMHTLMLDGAGEFNVELEPYTGGRYPSTGWYGFSQVKVLWIGEDIKSIPDFACLNPTEIYCWATVPPKFNNAFTQFDAILHVPASAIAAYFADENWGRFADLRADLVPLQALQASQEEMVLNLGEQASVECEAHPDGVYHNAVNYVVANCDGQRIENVFFDADGKLTPQYIGQCDVVATCLDKQVVTHVTVPYPDDMSMSLSADEVRLHGGQPEATVNFIMDGVPMSLNRYGTETSPLWMCCRTTDGNVAMLISGDYKVEDMAVAGKGTHVETPLTVTATGVGECDIVFYNKHDGRQLLSCHIVVSDAIDIDRRQAIVSVGKMTTIAPVSLPFEGTLWVASDDTSIAAARVASGKIQILGIKSGRTNVTVSAAGTDAEPVVINVNVVDDVNADGEVNVCDVNLLLGAIMNGEYDARLDVNHDNNLDVGDVNVFLQAIIQSEDF